MFQTLIPWQTEYVKILCKIFVIDGFSVFKFHAMNTAFILLLVTKPSEESN